MRNIFKITLFLFVWCCNSFATNTNHSAISNNFKAAFLVFNTDPKNPDPKKTPILNDKNETDIIIENDTDSYLAKQLINVASDNLGVTYRGGGTTKAGFDCSGLMYSTFNQFGIALPRSSYQMAEVGSIVDFDQAKKGDLIFFINRGGKRINHVGMIVEVNGDDIKFIHSSTQSGVIISSLKEPYYDRTFKQINRVIASEE